MEQRRSSPVWASISCSNALAFFCKPETLRARSARQELLANHDILRMVRTAWSEAAVAGIRSYVAAYPALTQRGPIQLLFEAGSSPEFLDVLNSLTVKNFIPQERLRAGPARRHPGKPPLLTPTAKQCSRGRKCAGSAKIAGSPGHRSHSSCPQQTGHPWTSECAGPRHVQSILGRQ